MASAAAGIDSTLVNKAVKSLLDYELKKKAENDRTMLIEGFAKPILVQIQLRSAIGKPTVRPIRIPVPNSLFSSSNDGHNICAFVRSTDKEEIESAIQRDDIQGVTRVITINEVRKLYAPYKDRKKLLSDHTHFVCDARVMNQLYNLLGNVFSARNNYPVPLDYVNAAKFGKAIALFKESTYMQLSGQNITIRFGYTNMGASSVASNISNGLDFAVSKIPHQWGAVHSIHLKSADSASLPIYNKLPSDSIEYLKKQMEAENAKISAASVTKKSKKGSKSSVEAITQEEAKTSSAEQNVTRKLKKISSTDSNSKNSVAKKESVAPERKVGAKPKSKSVI